MAEDIGVHAILCGSEKVKQMKAYPMLYINDIGQAKILYLTFWIYLDKREGGFKVFEDGFITEYGSDQVHHSTFGCRCPLIDTADISSFDLADYAALSRQQFGEILERGRKNVQDVIID